MYDIKSRSRNTTYCYPLLLNITKQIATNLWLYSKLQMLLNFSLRDTVRLLLKKNLLSRASQIADNAKVLGLSQIQEFESTFVREMHF